MSPTAVMRTTEFADVLLDAAAVPLPPDATIAAKRSMFNVLGTAVGAAWSPAADAIIAAARELSAPGRSRILGRSEVLDEHWAALFNGTASHYDDFDDTHLATVIHPGAATLAVLVALHDSTGASGEACLRAFAFGCEVQLRIGNAISPNHYDRGWHITGTCGVFGATVAAALLMGLNGNQLRAALAAASTMTLGQREAFGSMTKPYHAGKAAANGILAARLGSRGYTGDADPLGDTGVLTVFADSVDESQLLKSWTDGWELERNAFKPYPCGIVAHPAIDAAIDACGRLTDPSAIESVEVSCHPLVPELMGIVQPEDGLQARFSARHGVAVGLLDGRVGLHEFSDTRATAPDVRRVRGVTDLIPSSEIARDEAKITVSLADGTQIVAHVPHARGSLARPLTDAELLGKVDALMVPVLGAGSAARISQLVETVDVSTSFADIVAAARPKQDGPA
ncbi:MmgE/PrpD family protein [Mycobacterium sp. ACS1612]|uniref:MmgE/PrpD family protein n=1 Tax=Mycobacterium sp. ACS1612 TaxID=1834117 RepID=UPI001E469951|nr:MmgE/PrpD family protein [Mycobacterium sp. ACS1612]